MEKITYLKYLRLINESLADVGTQRKLKDVIPKDEDGTTFTITSKNYYVESGLSHKMNRTDNKTVFDV